MRGFVVLLALVCLGSPSGAQQLPVPPPRVNLDLSQHPARAVPVSPAVLQAGTPPVIVPVLGGVTGGVVGFFAIGALGYELSGGGEICGDDPCGLVGGFFGAMIGEIVGVGVGAHLANARLGRLDLTVGASFAGLMVGSGLASASGLDAKVLIPLVGAAQLAAAVFAERQFARSQ